MVKKSDIEYLFNEIKDIYIEPGCGTLMGVCQEKGEITMKGKILDLMQDWYASLRTGATNNED